MTVVERLRTPDARFDGLPGFPFATRYAELPDGLRMGYLDEGSRDGETVLLLHGQPTWSYLYRIVVERLSSLGLRAVAPDLIGFGRSDKPFARNAHTVRAHVGWLADFLLATGLDGITLVVQDWGGPFGLGVLARGPDRFRRVLATNTALHTAGPELEGRLTWACHSSADATVTIEPTLLDYQRLTQQLTRFAPSVFLQAATASVLPDPVLAAYDAPFPTEEFCAGPRQLPLLMGLTPSSACARLNRRTMEVLGGFKRPFLTAFSDGDPGTAGWDEVLRTHVPGAQGLEHPTLAGAGHFVQEDRGRELADVIAGFVGSSLPTR
jgi:haloalkane dehalogenase